MQSNMRFALFARAGCLFWILSALWAAAAVAEQPSPWLLPNFSDCLEVVISNPADHPVDTVAAIPVAKAGQTALQFPGTTAVAVLPGKPISVLPTQTVDLNGDGAPDEFLIEVKMKAHSRIDVDVYYSTTLGETIPWPRQVYASHSFGYNRATAALESTAIGYRTYGGFFLDVQARAQGKPGLNNSLVGFLSAGASAPSPAGMDILHIGETLGLGGLFLRSGKDVYLPPLNMPDYAHKPAPAEAPTYRVISAGPLRAVIQAHMSHWSIGKDVVSVNAIYSIDAGSEAVECRFRILPVSLSRTYEVGAGIRTLPKMHASEASGRLALDGEQNARIGPLGLAFFYDPATVANAGTLKTRDGNNLAVFFRDRLKPGHAVSGHYWVAADWSGSGIQDLLEHLRQVGSQARASVTVGGYSHSTTPEPSRLEGEAY